VDSCGRVSLLDDTLCPRCGVSVDVRPQDIVCHGCSKAFVRVGRIPVLLPLPDEQVALWRQQLGLLASQADPMGAALQAESRSPGLLPSARARLQAMIEGVRAQFADIAAVLGPALGGALDPSEGTGLPRGVVEYGYCLYRDWGWPGEKGDENEQAVDSIRSVVLAPSLGRTLVLGAGACRLAYDLHRMMGATETAVVDIDPFLLVIAEAVVRGGVVRVTEATANIHEMANASRAWSLEAPAGPLAADAFHFFFANGLAPPFRSGTFDTVVTPWFIDQVPADLPSLLAKIHELLAPGGRWINHGPLIYPMDAPMVRRFSREEVLELGARAGFRIERSSSRSVPHLVSPLTGRGKVERVLTFAALK
jgi:SAM-dependent methyltransferase